MKLNKRNCGIHIRLTPCDYNILKVHWIFNGEHHYTYQNGTFGSQFSSVISAVYALYKEPEDTHLTREFTQNKQYVHVYPHERCDGNHMMQSVVKWNEDRFGEERYQWGEIKFIRICPHDGIAETTQDDPIYVEIRRGTNVHSYTIDGRDLCYAIANAATKALKIYGFYGYSRFTGGYYNGDSFQLYQLLFLKAYALNTIEVREVCELQNRPREGIRNGATGFNEEMELLLFDM